MFDAITVEGALIAPAMLARIAQHQAGSQKEQDYGIPKGLTLRDEIARYFRIGQAMLKELTASATPSPTATVAFAEKLLRDVFGFADIQRGRAHVVEGRQFAVTLEALGGRVPVVVVTPADELDRPSDLLSADGRRRSAASALQDWLNAGEGALWGLCTNGVRLRLVRDNASLTRPAFVEADLHRIFEADGFADFAALWLLVHATRFGAAGAPPADCALERWRDAGQKEGRRALEDLSSGVKAALGLLGSGFVSHPDNSALRERLQSGALPLPDFFGQLLRLVYRLIFLLAAEDRNLLHSPAAAVDARKLYAAGYSVGALRDAAVRRSTWDRHHDRWQGLLVTFAALARGESRLGLPALGGLFGPDQVQDLESASLANRHLMEAVFRLAWLRDDGGLTPVNWRDMETEELGSVYESLLELTPRLADDGRGFAFAEGNEAKGHARKTSGSYYTPDSLVQALLDTALDPVLDRIEAEADDPAAALLTVRVIDPACGSGHFLLAAARRIATRLARRRVGGVASADDYRHALRDVVRACIHGVDRNPMAVELAKVALWIETVEPGKPLGFLDANIRCGDSLLGLFDLAALQAGIPDAIYKPLTGDDKATARYFGKRNKAERSGQGAFDFGRGGGRLPPAAPLAEAARALRAMPEDSADEVAEKRRRYAAAQTDPGRWHLRVAADLYVAAFLAPKIGGEPANPNTVTVPTTAHVWDALGGHMPYGPLVARAQDFAGQARAFHWPLEFPDVMAAGGFDVVLGNPPWERIKLQEQEFFAAREPEIAAAANAAARGNMIAALAKAEPGSRERALHDAFEAAKREAEAASAFARLDGQEGGRFPLTGRGDVNTYALFAELSSQLAGRRGRAGLILPTQIATADTTRHFFGALVTNARLVSFFNFFEIRQWFVTTDDRNPFGLLTIGQNTAAAEFCFSLTQIAQLIEGERRFSLTPDDVSRINPNTKTAPIFRSRADAELTAGIYSRVPVLIDDSRGADGNPWGLSFMRMLDMSNDSGLFRTAEQLAKVGFVRDGTEWASPGGQRPRQAVLTLAGGADDRSLRLTGGAAARSDERYVPLYEAKMIHQFDHRWATYDSADSRDTTEAEKADPGFEPLPRYWVSEREVAERLTAKGWTCGWLMGWRDICRAADERTVIATVLPSVGVNHKMPLFFTDQSPTLAAVLLANWLSLTFDYVARQKVGGTSLTYFYLKQLPVLPPTIYGANDFAYLVPRIVELIYTSRSMAPFARALGYDGPSFAWDEDRRAQLRAELDAWYARAYSLTLDELKYILDPVLVKGAEYPSETFRVLKSKEIKRYGEYRTAKLVLQAWERLERGEIA